MYSLSDLEDMIDPSRGTTPMDMIETADLRLSDPVDRLLQENLSAIMPSVAPVASDGRNRSLLEPEFWDGSEALRTFPGHLKAQLEQACCEQDITTPDCIKPAWPPSQTIFRSAAGRSTRWLDPDTGEEVLVARFHYGTSRQVLVAKRQLFGPDDDGAAFIISHARKYSHYSKRKHGVLTHDWKVWEPGSCSSAPRYVVREFQVSGSSEMSVAEVVPPVFDLTGSGGMKEAMTPGNIASRTRRASHARNYEPQAAGPLLVRRQSDRVLVQIQCPHCEIHTCTSATELYHHLQSLHGVMLEGYDKVAEVYGVPVQSRQRRSARKRRITKKGLDISASVSKRTADAKPRRRRVNLAQRRRPAQDAVPKEGRKIFIDDLIHHDNDRESALSNSTAQPPIPHLLSAISLDHKAPYPSGMADEIQCNFTFISTTSAQPPRTRPFASCDTVRKLFVQAHVAGVTTKDDLVLSCTVNSTFAMPMYVVRGDEEDFAGLVAAIDQAAKQWGAVAVTVFIMAEHL